MLVIDSSRAKALLGLGWLAFAIPNAAMMFVYPGKETIPYHLIWASFAFLYGIARWSATVTWTTFAGITVVTGIPLIRHARVGVIGWEECSEIILMGVIAALLVWHVNRHQTSQQRVTDLRESEQVRAHNRDLATRFGSHELRTRLTIARGFADLIRAAAKDQRTRSDAQLVLTELDKASVLATNLMTLVRSEAVSAQRPLDLDELIDSVVRRWLVRVDRAWAETSTAGFVLGDAERLEAALDCLIENAVKFTGPGDSIHVNAQITGQDVVISVEDSGVGIPPGEVEHVCDLFHISSNAGDRAGSGLGLPIVRAVAEARGGTLHVASSLGQGTKVTIRMPRGNPAIPQALVPVQRATMQVVRTPQLVGD
ncbi:MAG: Signal transduction histidine kinase [Pseudonocardiales bacterium]|nr:Signal transduction histidine kinase [Pseudonocardiales bacterium]